MENQDFVVNLLYIAHNVFLKYGYENTTLSLIANEMNVELSAIKTYYPSKEELIIDIFRILNYGIERLVSRYYLYDDSLLVFKATKIYVSHYIFFSFESHYSKLYLEVLNADLYLKAIQQIPTEDVKMFIENRNLPPLLDDTIHIYRDIIPHSFERSIVSMKRLGFFEDIDYDELPYMICKATFDHFVSDKQAENAIEQAKILANLIVLNTANTIPEELFKSHVYSLRIVERGNNYGF